MMKIEMSYGELLSNIVKRFLLLLGKLCGYKGFSVFLATMLLVYGVIGDGVWVSVVISALCGFVVPKTAGIRGDGLCGLQTAAEEKVYEGENKDEKNDGNGFIKSKRDFNNASDGLSPCGRRAVSRGKERIRSAVNNAFRNAGS